MPSLSREQLHELVWSESVRSLAPRFGLSDVGLKKVLQKLDIPVPERGYWAKLQAGKKVVATPLPPRGPGMPHAWEHGAQSRYYRWPPDPEAELAEPVPEPPVFEEPIERVEARVRKALGKLAIRPITTPHPAIRQLLEKDEKRALKQQQYSWADSYYAPKFASAFERRRLRLLNSLFLGVAKLGVKSWTSGEAARDLGLKVGVQQISFVLDHPSAKKNRHGEWEVRAGAADLLRLEITRGAEPDQPKVWFDNEEAKLEDQLTEVAVVLVVTAEAAYRRHQVEAYERILERRAEMEAELVKLQAERERKARERREREAQARRDALRAQASAWREAADLRAFIAAVEAAQPGGVDLQAWASWARTEADRLDPFANGSVAELMASATDPDAS